MLLTYLQRLEPMLKSNLRVGWLLVDKWGDLEPVCHRLPMPLPLARAMIVLAWALGWHGWAGATALTFGGIARIGEVLSGTRAQLTTATDLMMDIAKRFYTVGKPKSRNRAGAKTQHFTFVAPWAMRVVIAAFQLLGPTERIYPLSKSAYRTRWNRLLKMLGVSDTFNYLPGGLRGGGAVSEYLQGSSIGDLLWRMRIQNNSTLEHYLQEVTTLTSLARLPNTSREAIDTMNRCFDAIIPVSTPSQRRWNY
jgi:hypothetical protein